MASIVALCSTLMGWLATHGVGTAGLLAASVACGTALGMFNGALVTRLGLPAIVVTIGTVSLFRGISFIVLGDGAYTQFPEGFDVLGQGYLLGVVPYELLVWIALASTAATFLCGAVVLSMLHFASPERNDSLAAVIAVMGAPSGSDLNPVRLEGWIRVPSVPEDGVVQATLARTVDRMSLLLELQSNKEGVK